MTDVNDKPTFDDGDTTTRSIAENSAAGTVIGKPVPATDQDGDTLTYSLTGTDASKFTIDSSTGQIKVKSPLDYEADNSYRVRVNVTDGKKADGTADPTIDDTIAVTINVTDVNEPPPAPASRRSAGETVDSPESQLDVSWTAPDMAGKPKIRDYDVQYRLTGGSDSSWTSHSFTGTGTSTTLTGLTGGKSYEVQVRATNDEGTSRDWSDSGTAITKAEPVARKVNENSKEGTSVGTPTSSNSNGYTLTHTPSGADADMFEIDSATGQITVASGTTLDFESRSSYSLTVTVIVAEGSGGGSGASLQSGDAGSTSLTASLTPNAPGTYVLPVNIGVTDIKEPPCAPGTPTSKAATTSSITATWTAPDMAGKPPIKKYWVRYWEHGNKDGAYGVWTVYNSNEVLLDEIETPTTPTSPHSP